MTDPAVVAQETIYAGLDALLAMLDLDLCAYLHVPGNSGPQLFLRRPDLGHLAASEAFTLFGALRDALEHGNTDIPGYNAVVLPSGMGASRGLHAIGRRDAKLDDDERRIVETLCRATSSVAHALESAEEHVQPSRVSVEIASGLVLATVEIARGDTRAVGRAEAHNAQHAVAAATLSALDIAASVADAREVGVADDKAAVVLIEGTGARRVGSALCQPGGDPLFAFALAATEAAARLPR